MSGWPNLVGHEQAVERFRAAVRNGRLASTFLLAGPAGIGKRLFARRLAQALLCETHAEAELQPCLTCSICRQIEQGTHPDVLWVRKPADKEEMPVELMIGTREKRMREGLCYDISRKPNAGSRKIGIIDDADYLNHECVNALLKTLEEPPPRALVLLLASNERRQLPTIRSRSQIVRLNPLTQEQVARVLEEQKLVDDPAIAEQLAKISGGSVATALRFTDPDILQFRHELFEQLRSFDPADVSFNQRANKFVESAGKDAAVKRERMRAICDMAIDFYRRAMWSSADSNQPEGGARFAKCIDRCLEAQYQSLANMNAANLIPCFLSDLGRLSRGEPL